jgi:hypothetical protein
MFFITLDTLDLPIFVQIRNCGVVRVVKKKEEVIDSNVEMIMNIPYGFVKWSPERCHKAKFVHPFFSILYSVVNVFSTPEESKV